MRLSDRIRSARDGQAFVPNTGGETVKPAGETYNTVKSLVHFRLVEVFDMEAIARMPRNELEASIRDTLQHITATENVPLNSRERSALVNDLINEILGFGPIEPLVQDSSVQDILVNGYESIYVERNGILQRVPLRFRDNSHLLQIIDKIVSAVGRRIDESSPMVDARLPDGSRVNVIVPPLALDGPMLSIRKFGSIPLTMERLIETLSLTPEMAAYLQSAIRAKLNILISGGTGAGKTTLLNVLSGYIPDNERIITIEDSAELQLKQPHVGRLEARPANIEGRGEVTLSDLVKNSLRMRPDRIIVGEARGGEVVDMLQAMNTGHPGSMSTIHTNSPKDALARMEVMLSMGNAQFSEQGMRGLIASAIHIIVQLSRLPDGQRRVVSITEIEGFEGAAIGMQDVVRFVQEGIDTEGRTHGRFQASGKPSRFEEHIRSYGMDVPPELYTLNRKV
ncbi:CpaF family protein [uncultured Desulfosarcina sp.]|uniref:CpaF family protein n=1 Tax=uncultured Desulfosarcina sp. TaxID=218289 RepID=UPI0029C91B2B|nr:CpaF family protein [uncultured Desulfosarcina sp.]